jgi:hypothetical protein
MCAPLAGLSHAAEPDAWAGGTKGGPSRVPPLISFWEEMTRL